MDHDLDGNLQAVFAAVGDCTASFRFSTSSVIKTHSALLRQDVSSILTHLDSRLAASAFYPSVTPISDPLDPGAAPPPS